MNLESDKRLNIQLRLDFSSAPTGEARQAGGNPEAGWRSVAKAWHPNRAGPLCPASSDAGSAEAMESDVLPIQLWVPTASVGSSRRGSSAAVHCARQRMGGRPRSGKILRSSQS